MFAGVLTVGVGILGCVSCVHLRQLKQLLLLEVDFRSIRTVESLLALRYLLEVLLTRATQELVHFDGIGSTRNFCGVCL